MRDSSPMMGEGSLETYFKCINFRTDYFSRFLRILAFSLNYDPRKISQNFPSTKSDLRAYQKRRKWIAKVDSNDRGFQRVFLSEW